MYLSDPCPLLCDFVHVSTHIPDLIEAALWDWGGIFSEIQNSLLGVFLDNVVGVPNCIEWYALKLHTCVSSVHMDETNLCVFTEPEFRQNYNPLETLIIHSDATSSTQLFLTALLSMSSVRL